MSIQVEEDNTAEVLAALGKATAKALEVIGGKMESNAKKEVTKSVYDTPASSWYKRTGALRNSITHRKDGDSVIIGSDLTYSSYVELGTGKEYSPPPEWMENQAKKGRGLDKWYYKDEEGNWHAGFPQKPRPFLRPAVENYLDEYKKVAEKELQNA